MNFKGFGQFYISGVFSIIYARDFENFPVAMRFSLGPIENNRYLKS